MTAQIKHKPIPIPPADAPVFALAYNRHFVIQRPETLPWQDAAAFDPRLGWQDAVHNRYGYQEEFYHTALDAADLLAFASEHHELTQHVRLAAGAAQPYAADLAEHWEPAPEEILAGRNPRYGQLCVNLTNDALTRIPVTAVDRWYETTHMAAA